MGPALLSVNARHQEDILMQHGAVSSWGRQKRYSLRDTGESDVVWGPSCLSTAPWLLWDLHQHLSPLRTLSEESVGRGHGYWLCKSLS